MRARSKGETRGLESRWGGATVALGSPLLGGCLVKCSSHEGGGPQCVAQEGIQDLGDVDRVWEEGRSSGVLSVVDRQTAEDRKERGGKSPVSCPGRGAADPYKQEELAQ